MGHNCNKYIIEGGAFKRDFEAMYRNVKDPWDQKKNSANDLAAHISFYLLNYFIKLKNLKVDSILDIGCADGYYSQTLLNLAQTNAMLTAADISETVIRKAVAENKYRNVKYIVDDIRINNESFHEKFNLIYCSRTIYYVAPEIDQVIENLQKYLKVDGLFCFIYNQTPGAFSEKWLTYESLREKLISKSFEELAFNEMNRLHCNLESVAVALYRYEPKGSSS